MINIADKYPIDSFVIVTTDYGETKGCQIVDIKYNLYQNIPEYYDVKIICKAKNDKFSTNEYSIDCVDQIML